jgi:hypothetical protein
MVTMNRPLWLAMLGLVLLLSLAAVILSRPGEERQIRRRYRELLNTAAIDKPLPPLGAAARAAELASYFATNVSIQAGSPFPTLRSRSRLTSFLQQAYLRVGTVRISDQGHHVQAGESDGHVILTGALFIQVDLSGYRDEWLSEFRIHWIKEDDWLIERVERHESIQPAGTTP